jgi:membrane fusion protein, copper/silver efflux system
MTRARFLFLALVVAAGGFLAGRWSGGAPAAGATAGARKILHYVDPMHPAYKSDKPGIAPDCGMQLEPVYADGGPAQGTGGAPRPAGTVTLDPGLRQLQGVRLGTVERAPSTQAVRLFGRVVPDETRVYTLNAAMEGSIRELSPVTSGTFVHKNQWLGAFFSADTRTALQAYITALDVQDIEPRKRADAGMQVAAGTTPSRSAQFTVERLRGMGMSDRQIEDLRKNRSIPLTIDIVSPADGVVLTRNVTLGQKFDKGAEWFRVANLDKVWILADLQEADVALARPGAKVQVTVPGRATPFAGVVSRVPPQFDMASRTMKLRIEVDNPGATLRPDMFVDVGLSVERPAATTIPASALVDSGLRKTVFVERGEGIFEPRAVETGWRAGDRVEVVSGLEPGDRIVVSGTFLVDSESQLKAAAAGVYGAASQDPVCGMEVDEARARAAGKVAEHHGKHLYFCSDTCKNTFLASPDRFAGSAVGDGKPRDSLHASVEVVR